MSRKSENFYTTHTQNLHIRERHPDDTEEQTLDFSESSGFMFKPSQNISGRIPITGQVLTALNDSGKVVWAEAAGGSGVTLTGVTGSVILQQGPTSFKFVNNLVWTDTSPTSTLNVPGSIISTNLTLSGTLTDGTLSILNGDITSANDINSVSLTTSGNVQVNDTLKLRDNDTNTISLKSPTNIVSDFTLTLPDNNGLADQYITSNGSGVLSWANFGSNYNVTNVGITNILGNPYQVNSLDNIIFTDGTGFTDSDPIDDKTIEIELPEISTVGKMFISVLKKDDTFSLEYRVTVKVKDGSSDKLYTFGNIFGTTVIIDSTTGSQTIVNDGIDSWFVLA